MRKGFLGSIAALAAGAGAAWGQPPVEPGGPPAGFPGGFSGEAGAPAPPLGGPPRFGGFPSHAIPGNAGFAPAPAILPPGNFGPPNDPLGIGPVGGFGPPPGPMYPMPGPYAQQSFQPSPPMPGLGRGGRGGRGGGGEGGEGDLGYGAAPHWWAEAEYLLWFNRDQPVKYPLLTTSAPVDGGVLGAASTTILVGNRDIGYNPISGIRVATGFYGDADRRFGFNFSTFVTERRASTQSFGGAQNNAGIPLLARPFTDTNTGLQTSLVLSGPDFGPAGVVIGTNTQTFSFEPSAVWNLYRSGPGSRLAWSLDFLAGYRYLEMKEQLDIQSLTTLNGQTPQFTTGAFGVVTLTGALLPTQTNFAGVNVIAPNTTIFIRDSYHTRNQFNGFSVGLRGEARYGVVTASGFAKVAIGDMHERIEVFGGGYFNDPSGASGSGQLPLAGGQQFPAVAGRTFGSTYGGLLANNGNIGTFTRDRFTYVPEIGGTVGVALTRRLTGWVGLNVLLMPDVARPGSQFTGAVNSAAVPFSSNYGAAVAGTPRGLFQQDQYWLGGVNVGLQLRY